jgi:hypothetical protein
MLPSPPPNPPFKDLEESKASPEAPAEKVFESNINSVAASEQPAAGDLPLPSQQGKEQPFLELDSQRQALDAAGSKPQPEAAATPIPTPEETPPAKPTATPFETPAPTSTPAATPTPATPIPVSTPDIDQLAMLTSTPPPAISPPELSASPTPEPRLDPAVPPRMRPLPNQPSSSYRQMKEKTRISGQIGRKGPSSIDAVETPLGQYKKKVLDAIGKQWYAYMNERIDLVSIGTAVIEGEVDAEGKIQNLRVTANDSNEAFANICLQSFQQAGIPPIPPELVPMLPNGRLPVDISFTTYANR